MASRREKVEKGGTKDVLTTWEIHAENRWELVGEVQHSVKKEEISLGQLPSKISCEAMRQRA